MDRLGKSLSLCLVAILAVSVLFSVAVPVDAQTVPQPSVPDFSVNFVNSSYMVSKTNPYTGAIEEEQVCNASFVITIANQPFPYSNYQLYYNVRSRAHFEGDWKEVYPVGNWTSSYGGGYGDNFTYALYIRGVQQSNSSYTTISFSVEPTDLYQGSGYDVDVGYFGIPFGSQLDFQVEAQVGHPSYRWISDHPLMPWIGGGYEPAVAYDTSSGWSNTKTAAIGETSNSALPSPEVPEFPTMIILPIFIAIPVITAMIYRKKQFANIN